MLKKIQEQRGSKRNKTAKKEEKDADRELLPGPAGSLWLTCPHPGNNTGLL